MLGQRRYEDIFGHLVPYIRIKDYVLKRDEILKFTLESKDFLPTITLHVSSMTKSLSRENMPVDGDRISIGIREDKKVYKPISSDFIITSISSSPHRDNGVKKNYYEYYITGKLFIPNLDNGLDNFTYTGYAEEALKEACKRLGLGYVHTKNVKTAKRESWHCYDDPLEFIQNVTSHMWLAKDSFFDSWIDPRRNLTVVNVNDLLGRKLSDDGELDFTKYKNVSGSVGEDGKYVTNDLMSIKDTKFPKLFSNDPQFEDSLWYPIDYQYVNNSTNVSKAIGPQRNFEVYVQNNGVGQSIKEARHTIEIGVWYMKEKLDLGYVIANGPTNYAKDFKMADNGNWRDENTKTFPPILMPIESDPDADTKKSDQSNLMVSGNFSKEYVIAPEHNMINLAELEKQNVILTTNGANLGIMKGEKVPCFLYNRTNEKWVSETRNTQDTGFEFDMVCSGWFYVKAVELIYQPDFKQDNFVTDWKTRVTLTRREWFPPESTSTKHEAEEFGILSVDVAQGTSVESKVSPVSQPPDTQSSKMPAVTDIPTSHLQQEFQTPLDEIGNVVNELGGMYDEVQSNLSDMTNTIGASSILSGINGIKDAVASGGEAIEALKDGVNNVADAMSSETEDVPDMLSNATNAVTTVANTQKDLVNKVDALGNDITAKARQSIENGIPLNEDTISKAKTSLTDLASRTSALASSVENTVEQVADTIENAVDNGLSIATKLKDSVESKIGETKASIEGTLSAIGNISSSLSGQNTGETSQKKDLAEIKDDNDTGGNMDFSEAMAYDGNGLKHFMNEFIGIMNSEGIPYIMKGTRRWALDKYDNKVYGNAFTMRETSEIYKTLDSDGLMYWLSDYNSRHYYGEAIDIEPAGSFDALLDKMCLSEKLLDFMHKYGICVQLEVSKSGHSKGTHFHISTDHNNSQPKWWGIVNKRRKADNLSLYVVILGRDYFEEETKNDIVVI